MTVEHTITYRDAYSIEVCLKRPSHVLGCFSLTDNTAQVYLNVGGMIDCSQNAIEVFPPLTFDDFVNFAQTLKQEYNIDLESSIYTHFKEKFDGLQRVYSQTATD